MASGILKQSCLLPTRMGLIFYCNAIHPGPSAENRIVGVALRQVCAKRETYCPLSSTLSLKKPEKERDGAVRFVQRQHLYEEYLPLNGGGQVRWHRKLANLSPILSNGLIRVGGRIQRAPIAFEAAHPVILPKAHPVTALIVRHILGHAGREHVLSCYHEGREHQSCASVSGFLEEDP